MAGRTNREIGDQNHANLADYLQRVGGKLARRSNGDLDIARIVQEAPLTHRRVLYDKGRNEELLKAHLAVHGQSWKEDTAADAEAGFDRPGAKTATESEARLKRQISDLERRLVAAQGEVREVRQKLRRYEAVEIHLASTGRLPR